MSTVLYITANPKSADQSYSLSVAEEFLKAYRKESPGDEIVSIDLYKTDIPFVDPDVLSGWGKLEHGEAFDKLNPEEQSKVARINQMADQFMAADRYIFVTPLWNLGIPPKMKAYIDTIVVVGKTFKYTDQGPVGLLKNKKAVHIQARGGIYSQGPMKEFEFGDSYIRAILTFLGVETIESVIVEGMAYAPDKAGEIKAKAVENAHQAAKRFV
ncbi:MAG: FMN-dependent NADH-azoreductase [Peptococcaceae bacterium BICA1-7]|nr:MAG: FMN-dependent NADH-azoreductase [Peptococcaceae bacterium BICA1-7]HBV98134.1 FMN-dependent NADH-azoreductase [Desulfotomaculum sp.]